jgi:hypothetical protein
VNAHKKGVFRNRIQKKPRRTVRGARQLVRPSTTKNFRVRAQPGNTIPFALTRQVNIRFRRHRRVARRHNNATGHLNGWSRAQKTLRSVDWQANNNPRLPGYDSVPMIDSVKKNIPDATVASPGQHLGLGFDLKF